MTGKQFRHETFGLIIAQEIERKGQGLNLSYETLMGMLLHSGLDRFPPGFDLPQEIKVVMASDKISYLFADKNDVVRLNFIDKETIEEMERKAGFFGRNHREATQTCQSALIAESAEAGEVSFFRSETARAFREFRTWMYQEIYQKCDPLRNSQKAALVDVCKFFIRSEHFKDCQPELLLALMTDDEVDKLIGSIRNSYHLEEQEVSRLGIYEILPYIRGRKIDITQTDLSWATPKLAISS